MRIVVIEARRARLASIALAAVLATGVASPAVPAAAADSPASPAAPEVVIDGRGAIDGSAPTRTPDTPAAPAAPGEPGPDPATDPVGGLQPTIHYEDLLAHADEAIEFEPGDRVTVGFKPRADDRWPVGGRSPRALPAGLTEGRRMAVARQGSVWTAGPPAGVDLEAAAEAPVDQQLIDPAEAHAADESAFAVPASETAADLLAPAGLRREVFGFLPYWDVNNAVLHYPTLSTIAYFSVGADGAGNLQKKNSDGTTTVGWSGWTSSRMTTVINQAHNAGTRVVLTVSAFAWTTSQANTQRTLLSSATARANLASQIVAAVRERGADGVNLDFEPLVSGQEANFVSLVRLLRTQFNAVAPGYQITFDTMGWIGNYPIEQATAPGGADAIFIMGYDYRSGSAATSGSIDPLNGPLYDLTETVAAYTARVSPSKLILGVPYYGRAWSTATDQPRSTNISGTQYGASAAVIYRTAVDLAAQHGRRWDSLESSPWFAYRRENCTTQYGCVTSWRQVWYDDVQSLGERYDLVNRTGLRGTGIWSLGYEGSRTELRELLARKFRDDTTAPLAGVLSLADSQPVETYTVRWTGTDDVGIVSYDIEVAIDGGAWRPWLAATKLTQASYAGAHGRTFAFRVRARDAAGNVSPWGVASGGIGTAGGSPAVGGFARVVTTELNVRSGPSTSNAKLTTAVQGTLLSVTGGPTTSGGYRWWRVDLPVKEWPAVSPLIQDAWVAEGDSSGSFVVAATAPHGTRVALPSGTSPAAGARFVPLAPARLLDTRVGNGLTGTFTSNTPRTVQVAGRGGVPTNAVAVTGNLTVVGQTSAGYVSLGPTMTANPATSTLNVPAGDTRANGVTVKLGPGGTLGAVFKGGSGARSHLVLDVTGYLLPGTTGTTFYPLAGSRLLDTRSGNGLTGAFRASVPRAFTVAGRGGVPSGASAVTANVTVVGQTSAGYASLGPTMTANPATSTLNVPGGDVRANNVTLQLSNGQLAAVWKGTAGSTANLVVDVTGYFLAGGGGATYTAIDPVRLLDSRPGNALSGAFGHAQARSFPTAGRGTIPVDAVAITGNLTAVGPSSAGWIQLGPTASASATTSTLNVPRGDTRANGFTARLAAGGSNGAVFVGSSGSSAHLILDATGYWR